MRCVDNTRLRSLTGQVELQQQLVTLDAQGAAHKGAALVLQLVATESQSSQLRAPTRTQHLTQRLGALIFYSTGCSVYSTL